VTDLTPTLMASKGVIITQFDLEAIEALGLVKMDLLGIRGLSVLGDVSEAIYNRKPSKYLGSLDVLEAIPDHDPPTAELVRAGRTIGCFQIESPGMRTTLKEIQAHSVDDVMVALALYRPGPLTGGLKEAFVRRHRGEEGVTQLHPALQPLLADTYGVILYQEQVLRIAHELAGLSLADADLLRRAMSHFDPGEQMRTLKEKFIAGASKLNGVPQEVSERIWQLMAAFAGYGFPKAHAASYAVVSWRAAWCKAHEPAIFMAAVLANWGGYYGQRVYLTETRRLGLALRPPHINHAQREFSVSYLEGQPVLFMGLDQVRDLTRRTQVRIQQERPFHSLDDFLARVDPRQVEAENLIQSGALEGFGSIPALLRQAGKASWQGGQLPLFDMQAWGQAGEVEDWSLAEKMAAQQAMLGASVIAHPLDLAADAIRRAGAISTVEAAARIGQRARVAGVRQTWRRSTAEHGERIYLMSFEDLEGMLEVLIPGAVYQHYRDEISGDIPFLVEGEILINPSTGEPFIRAERLARLVS
jgi:DNA polymerase III alpha subunit